MNVLIPKGRTTLAVAGLTALLALVLLLSRTAAPVMASGPIGPITLVPIGTPLNNGVGIDYHEPTNKVIMSVNYPTGLPYNFELVAADGSRAQFSSISGLTDELKITTVRSGPCQGGFPVGEFFTGTGVSGQIIRVSANGLTQTIINLPGETGLMRGSLFQDRYCVAGGDLIVVTTTGGVWRINSANVPTLVTRINGIHLEGLSTVPNLPQYGPWAGKILAGAEGQTNFWAIDPVTRTHVSYNLGIRPEDIDIVPAGENFFGTNFAAGLLMGAPASAFSGIVGDFVIAQESPGILWHVWWNGSAFMREVLANVPQWEHVTFAPAGVVNILPLFTGVEGSPTSISGSTNLTGSLSATWTYAPAAGVDVGATCSFGPQGLSTTVTCTDDGTYNLTLTITNGVATVVSTTTLDVSNADPVVTIAGPLTGDEGDSLSLAWSCSDPGSNDTWSASIDWGDGTPAETVSPVTCDGAAIGTSHTYVDDDPTATPSDVFAIVVTVTDDDGGTDTASAAATIDNVDPVIATFTSNAGGPVATLVPVTVTATFTDVGIADTHTCSVDWGDASTTVGAIASGSCTATHAYSVAGVYSVSVTITDDDTGVAMSSLRVIVFDTGAGFVTGGGWFNSPAGAHAANASVTGKANYGFVTKYKKEAPVPTGQTEFQFTAPGFNFHSAGYVWLVVAGCNAQFEGTGTVNGVAGYSFLVTVIDGDACNPKTTDKLQITIWNGAGTVYASGLQAIGGGSIVIHK